MAWAGVTGLSPGGGLAKAAFVAVGDVIIAYLEALSKCEEYTPGQALHDFAINLGIEIIGSYVGDLAAKWGTQAIAVGLRKLGMDDMAEKLLRNADKISDNTDDIVEDILDDTQYYLSKLPNGGNYTPVKNGKISMRTMIDLQEATGNTEEFALLVIDGQFVVFRGGGLNYSLPLGTTEVLAHTHPPGRFTPSGHDIITLEKLKQESSIILTTNVDDELQLIQYTKEADVNHIPPPLDLFN